MKISRFDTSLLEGAHKKLQNMCGQWRGTTQTFFEPEILADESTIIGSINPILGGRFMLHEYKGNLQGKPYEGFVIYGYALTEEKFQSAWMDTFHMGTSIMFSESNNSNGGLHLIGNYSGGDESWTWRTEIDMPNSNEMRITAYNISPTGVEAKATDTIYKRVY